LRWLTTSEGLKNFKSRLISNSEIPKKFVRIDALSLSSLASRHLRYRKTRLRHSAMSSTSCRALPASFCNASKAPTGSRSCSQELSQVRFVGAPPSNRNQNRGTCKCLQPVTPAKRKKLKSWWFVLVAGVANHRTYKCGDWLPHPLSSE